MNLYAKPLPQPDIDTQPFWDACRGHELRAQRCNACGEFRWPPQAFCPECYAWDFAWTKLGGTGRVDSFVVVHYAAVAPFQPDLPYVIAHIAVDGTNERVRLVSNVIDCQWQEVRVGMPVEVVFDDVTAEVTLAKFRPV
jgi:uncharacterized OB-fold protein